MVRCKIIYHINPMLQPLYSPTDLRTRVPQQSPTNPPETAVPVISTLRTEPTTPSLTDSTETEVCSTSEKKATTGTFVRQQLVIALAVTATSAFLGGVMIIVLCRFIRKQRRKRFTINSKSRGDQGMMAMLSTEESGTGASGTYSVMSSMPTSFQPSGGTAPTNNCSDSDPQAKTYSEITSSAAPPEPSGSCKAKEIFEKTESGPQAEMYSKITLITDPPEPLGSCEAQENSKKIESDIYHMYCTIPDLHVTSKQNDSFYSLLQMQ
ncbi:uncharacterized protein [Salminus brasiliensis]|uniref:uncharacterized protein n=1 Tax=Salminus brasiliensis TaxID=930266 RepID=UPI003B834CAA